MNNPLIHLLIAVAFLAGTAFAQAQGKQVYTWTDENGVVHYVDTPPDNPNAVAVTAREAYRPGSAEPETLGDEGSGGAVEESSEEEAPISYADQKRQEMAAKTEERRARKAENDAACNRARQQVEALEPSRRVYYTNEQGEEERVDDEVRVQRVEDLKAFINQNCQ